MSDQNLFWSEERDEKAAWQVPDRVQDVIFRIECKSIPQEHAHLLAEALQQALPWLADEPQAGIHPLLGAESGNGWERPDTEILYLSRRQRLTLRLPKTRLEDVQALVGQTLDIGGHPLKVGAFTTRKLSDLPTLFAKGVISEPGQSESEFLQTVAERLKALDIRIRKMLCGKEGQIAGPDGILHTRSLMLAELDREESVRLQEEGIGPGRQYGCGLFLPQKDIKPVRPD